MINFKWKLAIASNCFCHKQIHTSVLYVPSGVSGVNSTGNSFSWLEIWGTLIHVLRAVELLRTLPSFLCFFLDLQVCLRNYASCLVSFGSSHRSAQRHLLTSVCVSFLCSSPFYPIFRAISSFWLRGPSFQISSLFVEGLNLKRHTLFL